MCPAENTGEKKLGDVDAFLDALGIDLAPYQRTILRRVLNGEPVELNLWANIRRTPRGYVALRDLQRFEPVIVLAKHHSLGDIQK